MNDEYIQVGETALRDPGTGEYLPSVPLYAKAEDLGEEAAESLEMDIARLFAGMMKEYIEGCKSAERLYKSAERRAQSAVG